MTTVSEHRAEAGPSAPPRGRSGRGRSGRGRRRSPVFDAVTPLGLAARYLTLLVILAITVGPMLWEFSTSLKSAYEDVYTATPRLLPQHPTFGNYGHVARLIPVGHFALNSVIVAVLDVAGNVLGATAAGYALARLPFRGRRLLLGLFLSTLVLPGEVTIISQYQTVTRLGFGDSLLGVALPAMIGALNVLLMRNAFRSIPAELEEAAVIDGATVWQRLRHIALPGVKGTLSVIVILTFIGAWDDFLWPLLVLQSPDKLTLTVGLSYLQGALVADPRAIAAGAMIALLPVLVLFVTLQRFFFRGVGEGAVKG
ncbi:ABC-type glycerol-3-phosphate transport system permease component [Kitasatospora sp. GAS204A]|uniref:carbohydrate ABC transporter permease n=1 Tax=unclassified Kitasatospora TaxID=2633591 RepID=UPI0024739D51|nr:carbohydrate ABC transporter permease [Kitasatospora sp. GAS204B]MDH6118508.1 ABC-type glycerol-3-phosphate transport system permease component [Kitasatospora sp. GAS204B]